tara:strand:+ start:2724 stop:2921 length:198 start_codon:yes stop_codon:yes gene_type:complete
MPIKFKKSMKTYNKATKTNTVEHNYIKSVSTQELEAYLDNPNNYPKIKQKVRNELIRRQARGSNG